MFIITSSSGLRAVSTSREDWCAARHVVWMADVLISRLRKHDWTDTLFTQAGKVDRRASTRQSVCDWQRLNTSPGNSARVHCLYSCSGVIMPPPHRVEALSDDARLTYVWRLSVCLSVAYIGPKSRKERPRKTKIGTEVAHVTRESDITFKIKRSKVNLQGRGGAGAYCGSLPHSLFAEGPHSVNLA